jgi:nitric oxide reductase subunit B
LFVAQTLAGAATQRYGADFSSFFGIYLDSWLPYNLVRAWQVQPALFWVATGFLAAGIFLVAMITRRRDEKGQGVLVYALLAALVVVVVGSRA